jgi:hypothetical protein
MIHTNTLIACLLAYGLLCGLVGYYVGGRKLTRPALPAARADRKWRARRRASRLAALKQERVLFLRGRVS